MSGVRPAYYGGPDDPYETVKVAAAWFSRDAVVAFCQISAMKYLQRAGKKPGVDATEDRRKAETYLALAVEYGKPLVGWACTSCGSPWPADVAECPGCRSELPKKLPENDQGCAACGRTVPSDQRFCADCRG